MEILQREGIEDVGVFVVSVATIAAIATIAPVVNVRSRKS